MDRAGNIERVAICVGGVAPAPVRLKVVEAKLTGSSLNDVERAVSEIDDEIDPETDVHATAGYRRRVSRRLVASTIAEAMSEAAS